MHLRFIFVIILGMAQPAAATTLWSGSLVDASPTTSRQKVSVNYPARGAGKICGVELKTKTMILNHRVWTSLLAGLSVSAEYDDLPAPMTPIVTQEEGGRLYFVFDDNGASYASIVISTKTDESVLAYIQRVLRNQQERAVFVAKECYLR